ncbi:MAG: hypothetical protein AAFR59_19165 [Bacteroidota bacterium]
MPNSIVCARTIYYVHFIVKPSFIFIPMITPQTYPQKILQMIMQDHLEEAMSALQLLLKDSPAFNDLILQSARYNDVMGSIMRGVIDWKDARWEKNQIRYALIDMARTLEENVEKHASLQQEVDAHLVPSASRIHNEMYIKGNQNVGIQGINGDPFHLRIHFGEEGDV